WVLASPRSWTHRLGGRRSCRAICRPQRQPSPGPCRGPSGKDCGLGHLGSPSRRAPPVRQPLPHCLRRFRWIELFRIEPASDPFEHFLVLLVVGILNRLHEVGVAPDAPAILWWT